MTNKLAPSVLVGGIVLALVGLWWLWSGLDIVQIERGWSAVIGGATIMSAGFVIVALAGVIAMLRRIAEQLRAPAPDQRAARETARQILPVSAETTSASHHEAGSAPRHSERQIVGRHVSGDATYVMFADGTVEAQTPDGVMTFASLEELRSYVDEREAATAR